MGGSSGGGSSSASQLPTWISGPHKSLVRKAESFAYGDRGAYTPYTSERIAGFNPAETSAFGARQDLFNRGDPMGQFAQGQLSAGGDAVPGIMGAANQTFSGANVDAYMSPYMQGVIDPQLREANMSFDKRLNQSEAQATARGGSVGSYRQGLDRMMLEQNRAQTLSDITGRGKQSAYEAGIGAFQRDRDARMGGAMNTAQASSSLAGTADQVGSGNLSRMESLATGLEKSGQTQRELGQRELDLGYSDFTQERDWPMRNMSFLSGILSGVPNQQFATSQTASAQPGLMSQLASLGFGAAAIQQGFGGRANGGLIEGYAGGGLVGPRRGYAGGGSVTKHPTDGLFDKVEGMSPEEYDQWLSAVSARYDRRNDASRNDQRSRINITLNGERDLPLAVPLSVRDRWLRLAEDRDWPQGSYQKDKAEEANQERRRRFGYQHGGLV